jgi:transposase-like protein
VKTIRRATRKRRSSEEKIQIVLDGLRGESSIAELCRREGIAEGLYYAWSKEFLEAGKRRLRALAIATPVRIEELPDVPTVAESGYSPRLGHSESSLSARNCRPVAALRSVRCKISRACLVLSSGASASAHPALRHDSRDASANSAMRLSARRSRLQSSRLTFCITIT